MKKLLFSSLCFLPLLCYSQEFKRKAFDYASMPADTISCKYNTLQETDKAFTALNEYNSSKAVEISKAEFDHSRDCPEIYESYGYSLFRHGDWLEGVAVIESGIEKFGSVPELIKRRSDMSLEMYELGIGQKNIDGSSVYKAKNENLPYDEEQFKAENLRSALSDLEYLYKTYGNADEAYTVAMIYRELGDYDRSTLAFEPLLADEQFGATAAYHIAGNLISLKNYDEAEKRMLALLETNPGVTQIYERLQEISSLKGNKEKAEEYRKMAVFYQYTPEFADLEYNEENYNMLMAFGDTKLTPEQKLKKLAEINKAGNTQYTIDVCIIILNMHFNHGNGVEEKAGEILAEIGVPALDKVHNLFRSNVSTCTITNLAEVMAVVKDERSWELLVEYLPTIANMPATLIPPGVPEKIVKFDKERGTREILRVVKSLLHDESAEEDPFSGFSEYVYYLPLQEMDRNKLIAMAREQGYNDSDITALNEKLN